MVSIGGATASDNSGRRAKLNDGINTFIEIMHDGSVRCRVILAAMPDDEKADIGSLSIALSQFEDIYNLIFGEYIAKIFISAYRYDKLTVIQQFVPYYQLGEFDSNDVYEMLGNYLPKHRKKYGNNIIISSNRVPKTDFTLLDKRTFDEHGIPFSAQALISELFRSSFINLGYIDPMTQSNEEA